MKYLLFFVFLFFCCSSKEKKEEDLVVVRVEKNVLTNKKLQKLREGVYKKTDKKIIAQKWIKEQLLYNAAKNSGFLYDKKLIKKRDDYYKNLIISSYLDSEKNKNIKISKKEINKYYLENKKSFKRKEKEVLINHYVVLNKKEANRIKKILKKKNKGKEKEEVIKKHKPTTKKLNQKLMENSFFSFVFNNKNNVVFGPKKENDLYHVVEILKVYEKDTFLGLEFVYDEIYNRLYKKQELINEKVVLDSLYRKADVFLEPDIQ
tara:strand:- start:140 stop:925 length:786 start_codon:yes stop_codon:yes gene_type:complete